ncbi:MAG: hypothetical protein Q8N23_01400 [Archangium sp.]|nr:hypothetical protein [Archangium sp.]MDP3151293.1 hypothetical protein [Archangium sp.]MDP3571650.1 hypothetical protein [Archangium sp.]
MRRLTPLVLFLLVSGCDPVRLPDPVIGGGGGGGGFFVSDGGGGAGGGSGGPNFCGAAQEQGVTEEGPAPAAITGGTMVALRGGGFVVADPDRARVWLVSSDFQTIRSIPLAASDEPGRVIEGADGLAYVSLRRAHQLAEIDFTTGALRRLPSCELPRGLAWRAADSRLVVACLGGAIETIDPVTATRTPLITSTRLNDLRDVVVDGARLLVTELRSAAVWAIAADGTVSALASEPLFELEPHVAWRAIAKPGGGAAIVRQRHRTSTLPDASNCSAYGGFATDVRSSGGGAGSGGLRNVVQSELLTVSGTSSLRTPLSDAFFAVVLPVDVAVSSSGRVAIVSAGTGFVTLLEPGQRRDLHVAARGVDTQLTSVVFAGESAIVFTREPAALFEVRTDGVVQQRAVLGGGASISTGHELFHRATPANVACASCHPEAGEDGHTWPFFEGARRTPTLRGGIGGTAPFHWVGDMTDMNTLMGNVMSVRMRGPALTLEGVQSVEDWLHLQAAVPAPSLDAAAKTRGEAVFAETGCRGCHVGAQGTNNATLDVGTGLALQVPRLVEFAWRGPWFHDGRMQTLEDRFAPSAGGVMHGDTASLSAAQRADLLVYLQSR